MDKPLGGNKDKASQQQDKTDKVVVRYATPTLAQNTVAALLESLIVLGQAGCFANLPAGSSVPEIEPTRPLPPCGESKANLVARIALYLTLPPSPAVIKAAEAVCGNGASSSEELLPSMPGHQCVWFAALRTLGFLCTGEPPEGDSKVSTHPHLMYIIEAMSKMMTVSKRFLKFTNAYLTVIGNIFSHKRARPYRYLFTLCFLFIVERPGSTVGSRRSNGRCSSGIRIALQGPLVRAHLPPARAPGGG